MASAGGAIIIWRKSDSLYFGENMIYTITFGGDARGWRHFAFTQDESLKDAISFQQDVEDSCIEVTRKNGDHKPLELEPTEWIWYPIIVDAFVRTMESKGYRLADSVALVSPGSREMFTLSCKVPKDWDHSLVKR
jgi:hypothetical protein